MKPQLLTTPCLNVFIRLLKGFFASYSERNCHIQILLELCANKPPA